jgi:preprotein translocase subunit SecF
MVDLMGKRNYCFALSILIFIVGIVGIFVNGIQMDIQFQGGTIMQIEMPDDTFDTELAKNIVLNTIGKTANVMKSTTYNAENEAENINLMVLNIASTDTLTDVERQSVLKALREEFNIAEDANVTVNSVEPFIGDEIRTNSVYAIIVSSILIIIYVWIRFKNMHGLSAGVFAVLALLHDIFVMFTVYVLFRIPLNDSFVAAMLTIIGYSINDTVIIYDRVRENMKLYRKMPMSELVNMSVVQTLKRSINTALTTLIAILTLYVFSVIYNIESIKEFTMPLVVGLISGTYSSIFIASPLYMMWQERRIKKKAVSRKPAKA